MASVSSITAFPSLRFYTHSFGVIVALWWAARRNTLDGPKIERLSNDFLRGLEKVGGHYEIEGISAIDAEQGPFVYVANHMSPLETLVFPGMVFGISPCTFVIKPSLLKYPLFGSMLQAFNPIVVTRNNPREDLACVLREGMKHLKQGTSVVIFPQGHRTDTFDPKSFNTLGMRLARKAGVSIIPVAVKTDCWAEGQIIKDVGRIIPTRTARFAFGTSIPVTGKGADAHKQTVDFIQSHLQRWSNSE